MSSDVVYRDDDEILNKKQYIEVDHISTNAIDTSNLPVVSHKTDYIVIVVLFVINLLNYIDRFTIPGVIIKIKQYYGNIDDSKAGILQTSFVVTYMVFSPVFGYLGDRMNRKWMIIGGISFWSLITLSSSFVPHDKFWLFVVMRSLVGIGEASYSTVAPTIISDLFVGDHRTKVMAFFYFAVPIGSGAGFIIGQGLSSLFGKWQAALWFTPIVGGICIILMVIFVREPTRGSAEGGTHLAASPWLEDILQLTKNRSFMLITFGFTAACFVIGSVSWFAVLFMTYAAQAEGQMENPPSANNIQYIFGGMTVLAGFAGVLFGTETGRRLRKYYPYADTLVCGVGFISAAPFFLISLVLAKSHVNWSLFTIFITQTLLCLNWALVTDMTMGVVIPSRRSTANAYQMILSHALGDAGSPYLIGTIKDSITKKLGTMVDKFNASYYSMQYALLLDCIISVIGGAFFILCSFYIVKDKRNVAKVIEESQFHYETVGTSYQPEDSQIISSPSTPDVPNMSHII